MLLLSVELFASLLLSFDSCLLHGPKLFDLIQSFSVHFLALRVVLLEGRVLEGQLFDLLPHEVVVRRSHLAILVALEDVNLPLQLIVFPVEEVDLALQFDDTLLVLLVLVLQVDLL